MRRKAQVTVVEPASMQTGGDDIMEELLGLLSQTDSPMPQTAPPLAEEPPLSLATPLIPETPPEMLPEALPMEPLMPSAGACEQIKCGIEALEKGIELFKECEAEMLEGDYEKQIEKLEELVEKMRKAFDDFKEVKKEDKEDFIEAEVIEEVEASEDDEEEEVEDEDDEDEDEDDEDKTLEASMRGFTRKAAKKSKECFVDALFEL